MVRGPAKRVPPTLSRRDFAANPIPAKRQLPGTNFAQALLQSLLHSPPARVSRLRTPIGHRAAVLPGPTAECSTGAAADPGYQTVSAAILSPGFAPAFRYPNKVRLPGFDQRLFQT